MLCPSSITDLQKHVHVDTAHNLKLVSLKLSDWEKYICRLFGAFCHLPVSAFVLYAFCYCCCCLFSPLRLIATLVSKILSVSFSEIPSQEGIVV